MRRPHKCEATPYGSQAVKQAGRQAGRQERTQQFHSGCGCRYRPMSDTQSALERLNANKSHAALRVCAFWGTCTQRNPPPSPPALDVYSRRCRTCALEGYAAQRGVWLADPACCLCAAEQDGVRVEAGRTRTTANFTAAQRVTVAGHVHPEVRPASILLPSPDIDTLNRLAAANVSRCAATPPL